MQRDDDLDVREHDVLRNMRLPPGHLRLRRSDDNARRRLQRLSVLPDTGPDDVAGSGPQFSTRLRNLRGRRVHALRVPVVRSGRLAGAIGAIAMAACGSRTPLDVSYTGSAEVEGGTQEDALVDDGPPAGSTPPSEGSLPNDSSTEGLSPSEDAGCAPSIFDYEPSDMTFGACWSCAKTRCSSQLSACAGSCSCNNILTAALNCVNNGGEVEGCFLSSFDSAGDPAEANAQQCLMMAATGCGCLTPPPPSTDGGPPLATACTGGGGGGGFGNGQCNNTWTETCGGTLYQVSCSCPEGDCVCFGPTTHVVRYPGCPYCPNMPSVGSISVTDAFALCGFPPYP
jgi:hypothetical protein